MRRKLIATVVQLFVVIQVFIAAGVANAQNKKVACVGDSITAPTNGWCSFMGMKLGSGYTAQTFGVSGTTLLKNVGQPAFSSSNQFKPSHDFAPNIVVIMLGTNDSMSRNWSAGKDHFVKDYEELIDSYTSLASKPTVFLNTVPPASDDNMFTISGTTIEKEINPLVKQVAMNKMCPVVDVWEALGGDVAKLGSFDGVHPGNDGAKIIGETVAMAILSPPSIPAGSAGMGGSAGSSMSGAAGSGQAGMSANAAGAGAAGQTAPTPSNGGTSAGAAGSGAAVAASAGRRAVAPATPSGNTSSTSSMTAAPGAAGAGVTANAAGSTGTAVNPVTGTDTSTPMTASEAEASGCSCHAAGSATSKSGPMAALFLLVAIAVRSRRRTTNA